MNVAHGVTIIHESSEWIYYAASVAVTLAIAIGSVVLSRRRAR